MVSSMLPLHPSLQIGNPRLGSTLFERMVGAARIDGSNLIDLRIRIVQTTKSNGTGRASLCTRRRKFPILHITSLRFGFILCLMNPLNTKRAFLHHTTPADRYIGIHVVMQCVQFRVKTLIVVIFPVERAHLIWAVVATITCANAAVIDLQIKILRQAVHRGINGANRFTRRIMALLTEHRLEWCHLDIGIVSAVPETLDPDPLHIAPIPCIRLVDIRNIILHGTGSHTSLTARAEILIDQHAPAPLPRSCGLRLLCSTRYS